MGKWRDCSSCHIPFLRNQELEQRGRRQQGEEQPEGAYDDWATRLWLEWGLAQHHFQVGLGQVCPLLMSLLPF